MKTRVTELFGIKYPIVQGGMHWISNGEFAAAVSGSGGLGIITAASQATVQDLRHEIKKLRKLTDKPFAVNFSLGPALRPVNIEEFIDAAIEEGTRIVETSGRSPEPYMKRFKDSGVKLMHKVARVRDARTAERIGADAVCIVGFEAGGHPGMDDVASSVLLPLTVDAVKIPVLAGGGICDARGFVAALALGAEGVVVGTRFMATRESPVHTNIKQWMLQATETDTVILERPLKNAGRFMKTQLADRVLEMESRNASQEDLLSVVSGQKGKIALREGDINAGVIPCGQAVGLVHDLPSVKEVIDNMVAGAKVIGERLKLSDVFA